MKIIFFNIWKAKMQEGVEQFIREQSATTDIFCFQEAPEAARALCRAWLSDCREISGQKNFGTGKNFFQAIYIKNRTEIVASEDLFGGSPNLGFGLYAHVRQGSRDFHVCNIHGIAQPGEKRDTPERIQQSRDVIDFLRDLQGTKIVGGDFNLLPETASVRMFREAGYRDCIKEFGISTTRNRLAWERFPENKLYHSDYVFVSPDAEFKKFTVPEMEISDHLPLIVELK